MNKEYCKWDYTSYDKKPWLIQRINYKAPEKGSSTTLFGLLKCDYMGAAEFEFGAPKRSIMRVCSTIDTRQIFTFKDLLDYNGDSLVILARTEEEATTYSEWIRKMCSEEYGVRLKEITYLYDHMPHEVPFKEDPIKYRDILNRHKSAREHHNFWWDIEFDMFFCFGKKKLENAVKYIKLTRDMKKDANEEGWY
jgi:hypothetical protein